MKSPSNRKPVLSVLVMAYKRKEFIMEAIESVLNQTMPRSDYEIICVVGFHDDNFSAFCQRNSIKEVFCDSKMGQTIASGIAACSGDVMIFIEDDDKFRSDKLERVIQVFKKHNCVYYHNNTELIDENSRLILESISPYDVQIPGSFLWYPNRGFRNVLRHRGDFNMSSIAVRRSSLILYVNIINKIEASPDSIIFFLLMQTNMPLYFDAEKTTFYRIHNSETNSIGNVASQKILDTSLRFYRSRLVAYEAMHSAPVKKIFLGYVLESKMSAYIDGDLDLNPRLTEKFRFFLIAMTRPSKFYMLLLLATILAGIFPNYVRRIEEKRRTKRYKQIQ